MPAFAQDESTTTTVSAVAATQRLEITDVNVDRYPRVTMTVDLRNVPDLDPALISVTEDGGPVSDLEVSTLEQSFQRIGIVLAIGHVWAAWRESRSKRPRQPPWLLSPRSAPRIGLP